MQSTCKLQSYKFVDNPSNNFSLNYYGLILLQDLDMLFLLVRLAVTVTVAS